MKREPTFSDNDLAAFLDESSSRMSAHDEKEQRIHEIDALIWQAIDEREMSVAISGDPVIDKEHMTALYNKVVDMTFDGTEDSAQRHRTETTIRTNINYIYHRELLLFERTRVYLTEQRYPSSEDTESSPLKKILMAEMILDGAKDEWLELADALLAGEPLDMTDRHDSGIVDMLAARRDYEDDPEMPRIQLYTGIRSLLELGSDESQDGDMLFLPQKLARAATQLVGAAHMANRHEQLQEIFRDYGVIDAQVIQKVMILTDMYDPLSPES